MPNYETMHIFAANLSRLLEREGMTQLALSERMNVSPSTVCAWSKAEKMPRMNRVEEIAALFGVSKSELLEEYRENPDVLDEVDVAFYGQFRSLSEDDRQTIRDMVAVMRRRRERT